MASKAAPAKAYEPKPITARIAAVQYLLRSIHD